MRKGSSTRRPPASRRKTAKPPQRAAPSKQSASAHERELTTKRRGELAELAFTLKAASLGFGVSKPYGDSERYDFILDPRTFSKSCHSEPSQRLGEEPASPRPLLHRIQVKCSTQFFEGFYRLNAHRRVHGRAVLYLPTEIDFLVAYIIPEDTWYIVPIHAIRSASLLFRRKRDPKPGLYDEFREAWHLLRR